MFYHENITGKMPKMHISYGYGSKIEAYGTTHVSICLVLTCINHLIIGVPNFDPCPYLPFFEPSAGHPHRQKNSSNSRPAPLDGTRRRSTSSGAGWGRSPGDARRKDGKLLHNYGNLPCLMGILIINGHVQ